MNQSEYTHNHMLFTFNNRTIENILNAEQYTSSSGFKRLFAFENALPLCVCVCVPIGKVHHRYFIDFQLPTALDYTKACNEKV